jgi:hypothetical protein
MTNATFVGLVSLACAAPFTAVLLHKVLHDEFGVEDDTLHDNALLLAAFLGGVLFGRIALKAFSRLWLR